jgi:hypothetical protein
MKKLYELADWTAETWVNGEIGKSRRIYGVLMKRAYPHRTPDYWDEVVKRKIRFYSLLGGENC